MILQINDGIDSEYCSSVHPSRSALKRRATQSLSAGRPGPSPPQQSMLSAMSPSSSRASGAMMPPPPRPGTTLRSASSTLSHTTTRRQSAFKAPALPPKFLRTPPLAAFDFHVLTADTSDVWNAAGLVFSLSDGFNPCKIEVATDWEHGRELRRKNLPWQGSGFLGSGHTKIAVYVSISISYQYYYTTQEYALIDTTRLHPLFDL